MKESRVGNGKKLTKRHGKAKRRPVKIPLTFDQALDGVLGLSAKDAKDVRESGKKKR